MVALGVVEIVVEVWQLLVPGGRPDFRLTVELDEVLLVVDCVVCGCQQGS